LDDVGVRPARTAQRVGVLLGVLLLTVACAGSGTGSTPAAPEPQVTSRPLDSSFVAVDGSGFPAGSAATVTGTTPQGSTTVTVTTDGDGGLRTSVPVPDG
jgi:hypothetical protein